MAYTQFDQAKPDGTQNGAITLQHIRENQAALRDMVVTGYAPGWNFTLSGGTAEQPAQSLMSKGVERLRLALTWGTSGGSDGNVTSTVVSYSANSGSTYDVIGTFTISYDTNGNVVSGAWE